MDDLHDYVESTAELLTIMNPQQVVRDWQWICRLRAVTLNAKLATIHKDGDLNKKKGCFTASSSTSS